jgi:hypothetical protein
MDAQEVLATVKELEEIQKAINFLKYDTEIPEEAPQVMKLLSERKKELTARLAQVY